MEVTCCDFEGVPLHGSIPVQTVSRVCWPPSPWCWRSRASAGRGRTSLLRGPHPVSARGVSAPRSEWTSWGQPGAGSVPSGRVSFFLLWGHCGSKWGPGVYTALCWRLCPCSHTAASHLSRGGRPRSSARRGVCHGWGRGSAQLGVGGCGVQGAPLLSEGRAASAVLSANNSRHPSALMPGPWATCVPRTSLSPGPGCQAVAWSVVLGRGSARVGEPGKVASGWAVSPPCPVQPAPVCSLWKQLPAFRLPGTLPPPGSVLELGCLVCGVTHSLPRASAHHAISLLSPLPGGPAPVLFFPSYLITCLPDSLGCTSSGSFQLVFDENCSPHMDVSWCVCGRRCPPRSPSPWVLTTLWPCPPPSCGSFFRPCRSFPVGSALCQQ